MPRLSTSMQKRHPWRAALVLLAALMFSGLAACDRRPADPNRPTTPAAEAPA